MKKIYTLFSLMFVATFAMAQVRYVDASFGVSVETDITYGSNISILTGTPLPIDLVMDVYTPEGDTETERPLILVSHTGSFLPPLFNGQITGAKSDSTVVYVCTELAKRGYVAAAYTYRQGWLPTAQEEDTRRGTLLQAAYRGIQDSRSCVRFFRMTAAEMSNPYGIDSERVGMVGIGTGGYLSFGCGSLYDFDDVLIEKFINTTTATPYIDSTIFGNIYADAPAAICLANHPGYSSEIDFAFNLGGALGDNSWIGGDDNEAAFAGIHATNDVFAPYIIGPVIVPTTNEFVVNVSGTHAAITQANAQGNNAEFDKIIEDPLADLIEAQKAKDITLYTGQMTTLGADNFYAFETPFPQGSPWDWWDKPTLDAIVAGTNAAIGTNFNSDTLHLSGLATNPDMSAMKGRTYMDTIMTLMIPRSCVALRLGCEGVTSVEDQIVDHGIAYAPNPARDNITFTSSDAMIRSIQIVDIKGQLVSNISTVDNTRYTLERNNLGNGIYFAHLQFDDGRQTVKFVFK